MIISVTAHAIKLETYNRLQNSSILLPAALAKSTMIQILVKLEIRQSEFGISAGRLRLTW